ncbi:hypothetical protein ABLG96_20605 [Nakamurella sp. A5-74]|uniref:Uncharacterized protein n=1 Tax=Nakamurella sp. A5-74 TaxID=3158264 RepID=A0AAU8DQH5_9ACTN
MSVFTASKSITPPARWADYTGRTLMAVTGLSTLIPFANGISRVANAPEAYMLTEFWRTTAYLVFAGLWLLLAWAPRRQRGIWELLLIQKSAVSVFALVNLGATDSVRDSISDSSLVVATLVAYVLCRGWQAWRADDAAAPAMRSPQLPA